MNKYTLTGLSIISGILASLAWTNWCPGLILLISFVPLILIENNLYQYRKKYADNAMFLYSLPGFVIFSILSMGWVRVATITGAVFIILGLSFLMSITLWLVHLIRMKAGNFAGITGMISFWLTLEYLNLNIPIFSPWINLGNGLAKDILFIQWYEFTGTAGGTLWILCSNIAVTAFIISVDRKKHRLAYLIIALCIILIPAVSSLFIYNSIKPDTARVNEVVIIQPNVDPYSEKFTRPFTKQWRTILSMAESGVTDSTTWVVTPETSIDDPVNEDGAENNIYIKSSRDFLNEHSRLALVAGMVSYKTKKEPENPDTEYYNSALYIDRDTINFYHKSKLVPGIESQLKIVSKLLPYFGGTSYGYGIQKERSVFEHSEKPVKAGPVICYESVFGNYVAGYIRKGAEVIFIITNDGWWKNTNGYKQHLNFASLRAIETRRQVVRSANTGISCIIDIRGKRVSESEWWKPAIIKGNIFPEKRITLYVKYGDYLMITAIVITCIIILIVFVIIPPVRRFLKRNSL